MAVLSPDKTKLVRFFELAVKLSAVSESLYDMVTKHTLAIVLDSFFDYDILT